MSKYFFAIAFFFSLTFSLAIGANVKWPDPSWEINPDMPETMSLPNCKAFIDFSFGSKKFSTDGLVIIKDGVLQYESYASKYGADKPHILWSVSKTITGALLGTAVRDGKIKMQEKISDFYPRPVKDERYEKIKIENLFYLDAGFIWNEFYSGDVRLSPVVNMLYGKGHVDMADFASRTPLIPQGPSYEWNYSTGTPTLTMGVLKTIYGKDYEEMPWKNFAGPLGLEHFVFEKDKAGTFNGGASTFATPRDMAKIGYLYLNNGKWNGKTILTEDWIKKTLTVSPGFLSNGTIIHDITDDGVFGGSIWLNRAVKPGFGKPYPYSPEDMFLAIGHYGQLIIILPSQNMVIARTGYDKEYNSYIDEFVTRAISCFDDPSYPIGKVITPPKSSKSPLSDTIATLKSGIAINILQPTVAKNICSCHFVSGLDVNSCFERSYVPYAKKFVNVSIVKHPILAGVFSVKATPTLFGKKLGLKSNDLPVATYDSHHPEFGCALE